MPASSYTFPTNAYSSLCDRLRERSRQPLEPGLEHLVRDREREPRPARPARAEALPGGDREAVLREQKLRREPVGEFPPEVEGALALEVRKNLAHALAPAPVGLDALGDRPLRPGQRRDPRMLDRREDPDAVVVGEQIEAGHDLRVADDEAEPPAGHAVGLRHREHLDTDLARTRFGQERLRRAPVEDDVAVREVV